MRLTYCYCGEAVHLDGARLIHTASGVARCYPKDNSRMSDWQVATPQPPVATPKPPDTSLVTPAMVTVALSYLPGAAERDVVRALEAALYQHLNLANTTPPTRNEASP